MRFAYPLMLNFLWILPVLILVFIWSGKKRERLKGVLGDRGLIERISGTVSSRKRKLVKYLQFFTLLFLILVLARPQIGTHMEEVKQKGVDVVLVVDVSTSMLADDLKPSRIELAKREVADFIDNLRGHRIGLVAFAGSSFILSPLTMDYSALKIYLDILDTNLIPYHGTAIGTALKKADSMFDPKILNNKVIVLITDGEDHEGNLLEVCKELKKKGITLFAIGIGTTKGVPINIINDKGRKIGIKKDSKGGVVMSKMNPELLAKAAALSGGKYFTSSARGLELEKIKNEIDKMEGRDQKEKFLIHYDDRFQIFLFVVLLLWLVIFFIGDRRGFSLGNLIKKRLPMISIIIGIFFVYTPSSHAFLEIPEKESKKANDLYLEGKYDEALELYDKLLEENPQSYELVLNKANIFYKQGKYEEALAEYEKCSSAEVKQLATASLYNKANSLFRMDKYTEALEFYKGALKLSPSDLDAKYNLEVTLKKMEEQQQQQQEQEEQEDKKEQKQDQEQKEQEQKEQEQKEQEKKEQQEKEQEQQKKDQEQQDKKDQEEKKQPQEQEKDKQEKEKKEEQEQKEQEKKEQQKKEQEQKKKDQEKEEQEEQKSQSVPSGAQPEDEQQKMKKREALKLLDALKDDEKDMQREIMHMRIETPDEKVVEKDW